MMDKRAVLKKVYNSAFENELEKISSTYYHGHILKNISKILKKGLPTGEYVANTRRLSGMYAGQYKKSGRLIQINIPKGLKKKYLKTDPINVGTRGDTPPWMRGSFLTKKPIPKEWIKQIKAPSQKTIKRQIDEVTIATKKRYGV
jgi:hypothetical protein